MKIKNSTLILTLSLTVLLAGCGGVYKQSDWAHSNTEADWDIDSAVCLQESETLTAEDLAAIEKKKQAFKGSGRAFNSPTTGANADIVSALSGLLSTPAAAGVATAEETHKQGKFSACINAKDWESK